MGKAYIGPAPKEKSEANALEKLSDIPRIKRKNFTKDPPKSLLQTLFIKILSNSQSFWLHFFPKPSEDHRSGTSPWKETRISEGRRCFLKFLTIQAQRKTQNEYYGNPRKTEAS
jgi:hypothetical protein